MKDYDVLIIGSGIGGLTCGARLSVLGYKVAVFDHHYLPGGYATNFKRKGYTFDVSLHGVGGLGEGQSFHQILLQCDAASRITPIRKECPYSVFMENRLISIPADFNEYLQFLQKRFTREKEGIIHLFQAILQLQDGLRFISDPAIPNWKKGVLFPVKCRTLMKWANKTTRQVIQQYVQSEEFLNFFTVLWGYYGLPPQTLSALYFFLPWIGYHIEGTYYIKGGSQSLSNALVDVIRENGGEVYLRKEVIGILTRNHRAYGVQVKDGSEYKADWIVSNASPHRTMELVMTDASAQQVSGSLAFRLERYQRKLQRTQIGPSLLQLYVGLACHPEELGILEEDILFIEEQNHEKDYQNILNGSYDSVNFCLTNYNKMDPALNSQNKGVVTITCIDMIKNWPEDQEAYTAKKKEITDLLLNRLESYYPGFKEKVVITELGTPRTMERYTKNPEGAVYGFAQTVTQAGLKRTGSKTPVANLSLVGAWTQPGGGYQGAATSGYLEAERIHKRLKRQK
jgi:all-trans-retinol 13,14-reductase